MGDDIYIGIDGTGPMSDSAYSADFANSHVKRLHATWSHGRRGYRRGPSIEGLATGPLATWATRVAKAELERAGEGARLFLCGYSRGGAAAIRAAANLAWERIPVQHLMLFDAVDRSAVVGTGRIPDNVAFCSHARRDPEAGSREMFGNTGTRHGAETVYREEFFFCTHGGVGGMPWTTAGAGGRIEEMTDREAAAMAGAGSLGNPARTGRSVREAIVNKYTNVTVAQDRTGARESWAWMQERLAVSRRRGAGGGW